MTARELAAARFSSSDHCAGIAYCVDLTDESVVDARVVSHGDGLDELAATVREALDRFPDGVVRVADESDAAAVRAALECGQHVQAGASIEIEDLRVPLQEFFEVLRQEPTLFEHPSVTRSDVALTVDAARALWLALPHPISLPMAATLPYDGLEDAAVMLLKHGGGLSLMVLEALEDLDDDDPEDPSSLPLASRMLMVEKESSDLTHILREIRDLSLTPPAPGFVPLVMAASHVGLPRRATADDHRILAAAAHAALRLLEDNPSIFDPDGVDQPVSFEGRIEEVDGSPEVSLTLPHHDWHADCDHVHDHDHEHDHDHGHDDRRDVAHVAVNTFAQHLQRSGWDGDVRTAAFVAGTLLDFRLECFDDSDDDVILDDWVPDDVDSYMLDYAPRQVSFDLERLEEVPKALAGFFAWLAEAEHVSKRTAARLAARARKLAPRFVRAASDPKNFGIAKSLFWEMSRAGVDTADREAVASFMTAYNARLDADARTHALAAPRPPNPARWSPSSGESRPDAKAPCPCGSGRRYKKCCMPR